MTLTLSSITRGGQPQPPRIVVYGPHGVGKTTFGASAPGAVVLRTEDGLATIDVPTFPIASSYADVLTALRVLAAESHEFEVLVLDSLDWLEPLVWAAVAREQGKDSIEEIPYGKGYIFADEKWAEVLALLDRLRGRGMVVVLIAHSEIKRFDAPDTEPYDRYQIKLHKRAAALVREWADVIGFAHQETFTQATDAGFNRRVTRGVGSGRRLLSVDERPAYDAKNRYRLRDDLPLEWSAVIEAIGRAYAPSLGAAVAPIAVPEPVPVAVAAAGPDETPESVDHAAHALADEIEAHTSGLAYEPSDEQYADVMSTTAE